MAGSAPTLGLAVVCDAEEWRPGELFDERGELMMLSKAVGLPACSNAPYNNGPLMPTWELPGKAVDSRSSRS
jgi:hypothetical protein